MPLYQWRKPKNVALIALLCLLAISNMHYRKQTLSSKKVDESSFFSVIPYTMKKKEDITVQRALSIAIEGGGCEWTKAVNAPQKEELFSTVIAAYPGSGKRNAFMQLEGLTALITGDDHGLNDEAPGNKFAYMKTSYPQHEGLWSWGDMSSQAVFVMRNPRWALVDYQHLLHEILYTEDWYTAYNNLDNVFTVRPPVEDWITWRELRFDSEIHWWSWHLDYWMEGGLLRDIFTHELTTAEHFQKLLNPQIYSEAELREGQSALGSVDPTYDYHCNGGDMPSCTPVAIASYERILDEYTGPDEIAKFVAVIEGKPGIDVITPASRSCVWRELILHDKSDLRDERDREGPPMEEYTFTSEQLLTIISELERVKHKYSMPEWSSNPIAQDIVEYAQGYIAENQLELDSL